MLRGPLGNTKYKPKFSGHDTFPFRYAWLTKLVNYLEDGKAKTIKESDKKIVPIFKDFYADYYKRAEGDVHFVCNEGVKIKEMLKEVIEKNVRVNEKINVNAYVPDKLGDEVVAKFSLTLSLKAY